MAKRKSYKHSVQPVAKAGPGNHALGRSSETGWGYLWQDIAGHRAALRFLITFIGALVVYFVLTASIQFQNPADAEGRPMVARLIAANQAAHHLVLIPYQEFLADCTGGLLNWFGYGVATIGREIRSPAFAVSVASGCDAMELTLLWWVTIFAFPSVWSHKLIGWIAGTLAIAVLNFIRIVSLWVVGVHGRSAFDLVHFGVWPFVLTCSTVVLFVAWLRYATPPRAGAVRPA